MYDVIIIGKGPAGISASLYARRSNLKTLVIGKAEGALLKAEKVDNYYGFPNGINGEELIENGIKQAENLGIEIVTDEVLGITFDKGFNITTKTGKYDGKTLIIATGAKRIKSRIKGLEEFEGKGISYCATCDAFFYRNKNVAVLGEGEYAIHEAVQLLPIVKSLTLLTNGKEKIEYRSEDIKVNEKPVKEIVGDTRLEKVKFEDDSTITVDGIFIAEGTASSVDFARTVRDNCR